MKEQVIVVPPKDDGLTTPENKRIPVPEHVEPEPKSVASGVVFSSIWLT